MNNHLSLIKKYVDLLSKKESTDNEVPKLIDQLHKILIEATGISGSEQDINHLAAVPTAHGKALGLSHAAQCLLDYHRTHKFLLATYQAVMDETDNRSGIPLHFFYVGCGPYAPFFVFIAALFGSKQVQFTLLEVNQLSVDSLNRLIHFFEIDDFVKEIICNDATTITLDNAKSIDILFSETLDAQLYRESYVPILINLLPQMRDDIFVLPHNVKIDVRFAFRESEQTTEPVTVFDTRKQIQQLNSRNIPERLPAYTLNFNKYEMDRINEMHVETSVEISKDIILGINESSLTIPLIFNITKPFELQRAEFYYEMKENNELKCNFS